jgi:hypothetical protein
MIVTETYIKEKIIKPIVEKILKEEGLLDEMDSAGVGDFAYDAPAFGDKTTQDHKNMIKKGIPQKNLNEDSEEEDDEEGKDLGRVDGGESKRGEVRKALRHDMVNMATVARDLISNAWVGETEDTARSKLSKISRGILPLSDKDMDIITHSLRASGFKI